MDPVTLVVSALVAAVTAGLTKLSETAAGEAYQTLRRLVVGRLRSTGTDEQAGAVLVDKVAESQTAKTAITQALTSAGVDEATRDAAQRLLDLLQSQGKYVVDASHARGVLIGDHSTQHNTFN